MSHIVKDSFYKDRYYQVSVSSWGGDNTNSEEQKKLKELSKNPLTKDVCQHALQEFGKTALGAQYAYLSFVAINKELYSLVGIEKYQHLQHINVSRNNLINLKPLASLKYVTYLNVSHNKLSKLLELKDIPYNLEEVDYSHNQVAVIPNLQRHRFLKKLNLSHNQITQIEGLQNNKNLQVLNLSENKIEEIENLDNLNLTELNLSGNKIRVVEGLHKLEKLRILNLSCNQIQKLKGLVDLISIRELWLSNNKIKHIKELQYVENLTYFSVLDLCFNPVQTVRYYRFQVLYLLPGLRVLDGVLTNPEEFVKSENLYGTDLDERTAIFKAILPDEEFIDRRINIGELIEPETESDNEEQIKFQDKYDKEGNIIDSKSQLNFKKSMTGSMKSIKSNKSTKNMQQSIGGDDDKFRNTQTSHQSLMNETARKLKAMRTGSIDAGKEQQQEKNVFNRDPREYENVEMQSQLEQQLASQQSQQHLQSQQDGGVDY